MHRPNRVLCNFRVQQIINGVVARSFILQTDFPMPIPSIGERVSYGPSNGTDDDGNAIIGFVVRKQYSTDMSGPDMLRISSVIDVE